ncbi:MAG: hypothetical protein SFW09_05105 [Hyphomicrobiaceae bacterium]|nr:hypothetical protein [Hyphomicrobiaceae bacterium]
MPDWLYDAGPDGLLVFLFVTLILGGLGAFVSGRAIAQTWRPLWHVPVYMLALAAAVRFIHFAIFGEVLFSLRNYAVDLAVLTLLAVAGFRAMRSRQMLDQYGWLPAADRPGG